jgi:alkylation response protein AidB-like acyl-CoA dehydrogenase
MDFSFSEEQDAVGELAGQVFSGEVTLDRIKAAEATDDGIDRPLWSTVARAGLLGVGVSGEAGGSGGGAVDQCRVLEEQGRSLAPVPLAPTLVAAAALDRFGTQAQRDRLLPDVLSGATHLSVAFDQPPGGTWDEPAVVASEVGGGWHLDGWCPAVASLVGSAAVLLPARLEGSVDVGVFLVDPASRGADAEPTVTTDRRAAAHLTLSGAPAELLGPAGPATLTWVAQHLMVALSAVTLGVAEEALRRAARYTSERHQFGKPLSSFQSTAHRAADAFIDVEAMRATLWQAAWLLDQDDEVPGEVAAAVLVARWWAADGGQRVVHAVQHVHGGMGADVEYPVHRFFLWAKQLELSCGSPTSELARLGVVIADQARATPEAVR